MNTTGDYPQVGTGWAFPPRWLPPAAGGRARVQMNDGAAHVAQALVLLLRTGIGSRVMRPGYGAGVDAHVFEPRTAASCHRLAEDVRRAVLLGEPRVIVDDVTARLDPAEDGRVEVAITYRIDRHRRPTSLVLPFYLAGAS
ncbi:GPW/gp25 family protein [Arthrobacter sp. JSM 101049]|uniref:GPW/gp25 family protein n=1 Tax=Arthrobacter sp. JSM 101049 TaxID=929097 RepID=UPI00356946CB